MKDPPPSPTPTKHSQGQAAIRNVSNIPASQASATARISASRPTLSRHMPSHPSDRAEEEQSENAPRGQPRPAEGSGGAEQTEGSETGVMTMGAGEDKGPTQRDGKEAPSSTAAELAKLKDAVAAKLAFNQQRTRVGSSTASSSPGITGNPRAFLIREESSNSMSPSLVSAFGSPEPVGARTHSTESTGSTESARTIRGSVPPTPQTLPVRTPSYPFPYVSDTSKSWSSPFHQPFTALSPTTSDNKTEEDATPGGKAGHESSSPSTDMFRPAESETRRSQAQPPLPNLYDLVLLVNSDLGMDAWWDNVTRIMEYYYGAARLSLTIPADASDIENVPWGQKATFNVYGSKESPKEATQDSTSQSESSSQGKSTKSENRAAPRGARPKLESRHSFAGHENDQREFSKDVSDVPLRPRLLSRMKTHAFHSSPATKASPSRPVEQPKVTSQEQTWKPYEETSSELDFSSTGDNQSMDPHKAVFTVLRALDCESDPLLDVAGVNRILEREKLVTLTRDYSGPASKELSRARSTRDVSGKASILKPDLSDGSVIEGQSTIRLRNNPAVETAALQRSSSHFDEYEQLPTSPWAQSPAPSPAIQADPSQNPFFASATVDEESFNPGSSEDYTKLGDLEAIGVDKAKTLNHIPLMHPVLSKPMHATQDMAPLEAPSPLSEMFRDHRVQREASRTAAVSSKKEPLAILSILSPMVPYPRKLIDSLKLLGPHLATSLANALQYSKAFTQATTFRQGRQLSTHNVSFALDLAENVELGHLVHVDIDDANSSMAGSITSPSEFSGRSTNSVAGTPGWDPSCVGFSTSHGMSGTPGPASGVEAVDNYFDAKRRTSFVRSSVNATARHGQHSQLAGRTSPPLDERGGAARKFAPGPMQGEQEGLAQKSERDAKGRSTTFDEKTGLHEAPGSSPPRRGDFQQAMRNNRRPERPHSPKQVEQRPHSYLHSYGADFAASFQSLPAATTPTSRVPAQTMNQARSNVTTEAYDMPPPSERLLRTIMDSLPVQIFTAAPGVGTLTWVNTKFLVYRGQELRRVLEDPWSVVHRDDRETYTSRWQRCLQTGQQLQQKVRLRRFDGQFRWFYIRVAPLKDKRQNIVHWIGTNMDIHDQHIAEMNLARQQETAASEAKYRNLANSSPQIVFAVNRDKGLTFCNTQWLYYSGQTEADALGLGFMNYVHPDDIGRCKLPDFDGDDTKPTNVPTSNLPDPHLDRTVSEDSHVSSNTVTSESNSSSSTLQMPQAKLSELADTGILRASKDADGRPSYSTEVRLLSKEGQYRWHLVRVLLSEPGLRAEGEETWYGTCTDINDHKMLEQTLKETMDAKSRFLSNMSHEIRTPLNGITGMVNFLIDSNLSAEQMEHVNIIRASTEGLRDLINDILDLSKVEAGMVTLSMDWLHVRSVIEEVNDLTSPLAIDKGIELNYVLDESVPSMVKGDRFRIRQVLLNVIGNGIKFTQHGEVFVRCKVFNDSNVSLRKNEVLLQFDVIDTGTGFSDQEAQFLFKRFSQIDGSSTRQHGGTGLGLVISMQLVELHGGEMKASSTPGEGSIFTFTIKSIIPSEEDHPPSPVKTPSVHGPASPVTQDLVIDKQSSSFSDFSQNKVLSFASPILDHGVSASPAPLSGSPSILRDSPGVSSGSSVRSNRTAQTSINSEGSSASSFGAEGAKSDSSRLLPLNLKSTEKKSAEPSSTESNSSEATLKPEESVEKPTSPLLLNVHPTLYSILVACPLKYSREATVKHIEMILPRSVPYQITSKGSLAECHDMLSGKDPVIFTHLVLVLPKSAEVITFLDCILDSRPHSSTCVIVITDLAQRREIMKQAPQYDYDRLAHERRLQFLFKPIKPSKVALIFDPQKEREMSTDRNQDSAQQVAVSQKQVYEGLKKRLGRKGHRVLLVEDNRVNQMVSNIYIPFRGTRR